MEREVKRYKVSKGKDRKAGKGEVGRRYEFGRESAEVGVKR